jgi:rare lipoprotein A
MPSRIHYNQWRIIALVSIASALAACGSAPKPSTDIADAAPRTQGTAAKRTSNGHPVLPPAGSGRGGYYLDDGPGDDIPEGLLSMPDPEPRVEPYSTRGNRPYVVFGVRYVPFTDERPLKQRGIGSWYGRKFHGQRTSSGEIYDMYKMSAAHPTLPIPSYARVTNLVNGRQVIVRVNDRGPFHSSRIIDLSYVAALKLGYLGKGSSQLEVERLLPEEVARIAGGKRNQETGTAQAAQEQQQMFADAPQPLPDAKPAIVAISAPAPGYYIQVGAFSQAGGAEAIRLQMARNWADNLPPLSVVQNGALYRVHGGPFATRAEAAMAALQLERAGAAKPMIVQR